MNTLDIASKLEAQLSAGAPIVWEAAQRAAAADCYIYLAVALTLLGAAAALVLGSKEAADPADRGLCLICAGMLSLASLMFAAHVVSCFASPTWRAISLIAGLVE